MRVAALLVATVLLIGCSSAPSAQSKTLTAQGVVDAFKAAGLPIGEVTVYTAESDPNHLLGRPNQYTAKVSWKDTRAGDDGGTVEVFANDADRKARQDYVAAVTKTASVFAEYAYANGPALLRIAGRLTPDQAAEYQKIFEKL